MAGRRAKLDLDVVNSYLNQGYGQKEIATKLGVHRNTLHNFLKEHDLTKGQRFHQLSGESKIQNFKS